MKKRIIGIMMSAATVGLVACACHDSHGQSEKAASGHPETEAHEGEIIFEAAKARAAGVEVKPVARERMCRTLKVGGSLSSATGEELTVVATVPGIVSFMDKGLTDGRSVNKGESLVRITAKNLLDGDPVEKARAEWETARREQERLEALAAERLVTQAELEAARLRCSVARESYEGVKAYASGGSINVPAPMSGFVKQSLVAQGDYVTVGQPLAVLTQTRKLQLKAEVGETDWGFLSQVDNAVFRTASSDSLYDVKGLGGRLLSVGRTAAAGSFYVPVTFEFNNVGRLFPGSYAEVWLRGTVSDSVLALPLASLTESQGVYYVYIQKDADCYEKREVKPGVSDGERVAISAGLQEGERVVVRGAVQVGLAASSGLIPEGHNHNH